MGGKITHDCGTSRSIGWFIEGILPLLLFCKEPTRLQLSGITNDALDLSIDTLTQATIPIFRLFGVEGIHLTTKRRGAAPKGGGLIELYCPIVRSLQPIYQVHSGKIRCVRGVVFCARTSPTIITRVIDSSKQLLQEVISDVYINADHYKGNEGGHSAGYSLFLSAETTTGRTLSVECAAKAGSGDTPEDIGRQGALLLLEEMCLGGAFDRSHQSLVILLMAIASEDVSKVRFGQELTSTAISCLRIVQDAFGITFKLKRSVSVDEEDEEMAPGVSARKITNEADSILLSCLGSGYVNMSRRIK
jgi:RNA 3'-terminal phosphate cyclase-like protein